MFLFPCFYSQNYTWGASQPPVFGLALSDKFNLIKPRKGSIANGPSFDPDENVCLHTAGPYICKFSPVKGGIVPVFPDNTLNPWNWRPQPWGCHSTVLLDLWHPYSSDWYAMMPYSVSIARAWQLDNMVYMALIEPGTGYMEPAYGGHASYSGCIQLYAYDCNHIESYSTYWYPSHGKSFVHYLYWRPQKRSDTNPQGRDVDVINLVTRLSSYLDGDSPLPLLEYMRSLDGVQVTKPGISNGKARYSESSATQSSAWNRLGSMGDSRPVPPPEFKLPFDRLYQLGRLSLTTVNACNGIGASLGEDVVEAPQLRQLAPGIAKEIMKIVKNPRDIKSWANLYLTIKYGILPTLNSVTQVTEGLIKDRPAFEKSFRSTHATIKGICPSTGVGQWKYVYTQKLKYNEFDNIVMKAVRVLQDFGLMPTLTLAWNLVPFSFVIDWFFHVDRYFQRADYWTQYHSLDIVSVVQSEKYLYQGPLPIPRLSPGEVVLGNSASYTFYERTVLQIPPYPIPKFEGVSLPTKNWLDGAALLVQKAKF